MLKPDHPPEWPDKLMFAAMLVILAGVLGTGFALLRVVGVTIGKDMSDFFLIVPPGLALALSAAMVLLGFLAIRQQASIWVWLGVGAGVVSLGAVGLVPLLSLVAVAFLLMSHAEGEATHHEAERLDASMWPDKALAASMLLLVAAIVCVFQAGLLMGDNLTPPLFEDQPEVLALVDLGAGLWCLFAAHETFHLRRPWAGYVGAALSIVGLGFLVAGPALGVAALLLLRKARAEKEFEEDAAPA